MKAALVTMLLIVLFVAGFTLVYKSAQSLMFIKPGGNSLFSLGSSSASSGKGVWRYTLSSNAWKQEKGVSESLGTSKVFEFVRDPNNTQNVYAATSAGLYFYESSKDAWTSLTGGMPPDTQVLSVSVNAKNASNLYISTLQNNGTSAIWRSQDTGKTFAEAYVSSAQNEKIVDVVGDWYNPQRVFALTSKGTFLRSDDGGLSWRIAYRFNRAGITRLIMDPNDSRILYVLQPNVGMLRSTSSGDRWQSDEHAFVGFPADARIVNGVRTIQGLPGNLYLATNYGILRSENGGKLFTVVHSLVADDSIPIQAIDFGNDSKTLYLAAGDTLYESRDGGKDWETHVVTGGQTITTIMYLAAPDEKIFAGS